MNNLFMYRAEDQLGVKCTCEKHTLLNEINIPGLNALQHKDPSDPGHLVDVFYFHTETGERKMIVDYEVEPWVYYIANAK